MKKFSIPPILLIFCMTVVLRIAGAEFVEPVSQYLMTKWTTEMGLPQNTVTSVVQTRDGYLWVATLGGLARFDGVKFTVFTPINTPVLKDNRFLSLHEDAEGILWINAEYGRIYYYENKIFHQIELSDETPANFFKERDERGNVLIANKKGLKKYKFEREKKLSEVIEECPLENFGVNFAIQSLKIQKDRVWMISMQNHLYKIDRADQSLADVGDFVKNEPVFDIVEDKSNGGLWIITTESVWRFINDKYEKIYAFDRKFSSFQHFPFIDTVNNLWVITPDSLLKFSGANVERFALESEAGFSPRSLVIDAENNFWVGTNGNGLFRIKHKRISVYGRIIKGQVADTSSVYEDKDGKLWIGTNGLLSVKNEETRLEWEDPGFPQRSAVSSIEQDKNGNLWFATQDYLNKITAGGIQKYPPPEIGGIRTFVKNLFFDDQNNLWAGTNEGLALFSGGETKIFRVEQGLVNNWVLYITQISNGDVWIGTIGGISCYHDGKFTNFTTADGLSDNNVRTIFEDADGTIWIGTYGGGINRFRDGKFVQISSKNGLPEDIASSLLLDDQDRFWILGNRGIFSVRREMLNDFADGKIPSVIASVFDTSDGMITSEGNGINQYSGWKARDGSLWFTMINGVVRIDPRRQPKTPPKVYVEEITVEHEHIDSEKNLEIDYGRGNIEINYTGLNLSKPENIQFRYRLEGLDENWNFVGKRRTAYFSYLPPGKYTFRVEAISASGGWSENEASVLILVKAPFWQTLWFYAAVFLSLFFLTIFIYQLRLQRAQAERLRQRRFSAELIKAHEAERKRIASDLHDGLGQNLLVIKNWAIIAEKNLENQEETRTHLKEISTFAGNAIEDSRNIAQNLMPLHLKRFGLTKTIENMLDRLAKAANIEINTEIDTLDEPLSEEQELGIYRIVQECMNNIVKHSETLKADVALKYKNGIIRIFIKDYGKGFNVGEQISAETNHIGFGLYNLVERVKLMNGKIDIRSKPDEGTEVEIIIKI